MMAAFTIADIAQALAQPPADIEASPVVVFDQANADTIAAIDRAIVALSDLRMLLDIVPDNRSLINGHVFDVRNALGEACEARARYIAAVDAMASCPKNGAH